MSEFIAIPPDSPHIVIWLDIPSKTATLADGRKVPIESAALNEDWDDEIDLDDYRMYTKFFCSCGPVDNDDLYVICEFDLAFTPQA